MKTIKAFFMVGAAILASAVLQGWAAPGPELLEKGIYLEETKGELEAASQVYREIVDDPNAPRSLAAQAHLRLGLCQLKLGNKPQAISALERLTREFPDKDALLGLIQDSMPQLLDEMVKQIEQSYILQVDRAELMETAIRAIIGKLDTSGGLLRTNDMEYLSTNSLTELNVMMEQQIGGIGAVLKIEEGEVVATPLRHSPALKAGLKAGDRIVAINGAELAEKKLEPVIKELRGTAGSVVHLTVKRDGLEEPINFEVTRDTIRLPSVKGDHYNADDNWEFMLDEQNKVGYLRLTQVGKQSPKEMEAALKDLQGRGVKGLILDLRHNGGGGLSEAIAIADLFVEQGTLVTVKSRAEEKVYEAKVDGTFGGFPMAVLVNRHTASAAEVVAACLQDHQRGTVVGERTFGQAIVRSLLPLKSGGALKLPVAAYYRPSGRNVNRYAFSKDSDDWGVRPDSGYELILTDEELKQYEKDRLARDEKPNGALRDRQLELAREYVLAQLRN